MEDRITARLAELEEAAKQRETELLVIRNIIAELRNLLDPRPIVTEGEDQPT